MAAADYVGKVSHRERKAIELVLQIAVGVHFEVVGTEERVKMFGTEVDELFGTEADELAEVAGIEVAASFGIEGFDVDPTIVGKLEHFDFERSFELLLGLAVIDNDEHEDHVGSLACIGKVDCSELKAQREVCC